jgi:hypothetical protein
MIKFIYIFVVFFVIVLIYYKYANIYNLTGVWKSDAVFNMQSEVSLIFLYITNNLQDAYLIIKNDNNEELFHSNISISIRRHLYKWNTYTCTIKTCEELPWNNVLKLKYNPTYQQLLIFDEDVLVARLFKCNDLSYIMNEN